MMTRSPTAGLAPPGPTASTMPTPSAPSAPGMGRLGKPCVTNTSRWCSAMADSRTRTWPSRGAASGRSSRLRESTPSNPLSTRARIRGCYPCRPDRWRFRVRPEHIAVRPYFVPVPDLSWLDWTILLILAVAVLAGVRRGFVLGVLALAGVAIALGVAGVAYMLVPDLTHFVFSIGVRIVLGVTSPIWKVLKPLGPLDHLLGSIPGAIKG